MPVHGLSLADALGTKPLHELPGRMFARWGEIDRLILLTLWALLMQTAKRVE